MHGLIFKILRKIVNKLPWGQSQWAELEKDAAHAQGKGWGGGTIQDEVSACLGLLDGPPGVFVDIGGNKEHYTKEVLKRFPGIQVFLFEPASANAPFLATAFSSLPNVHVSSLALSNASGNVPATLCEHAAKTARAISSGIWRSARTAVADRPPCSTATARR